MTKKYGSNTFHGSASKEIINLFNDSKKEAKTALMVIYSNIQIFRSYQTFGGSIPSLIFVLVVYIVNPNVIGLDRTQSTNDKIYSLKEFVNFGPTNFSNPEKFGLMIYVLISLSFGVLYKLIFVAETYIYMPLYEPEDMSKNIMLPQSKLSHIFSLPLMALTFFPRVLNLTIYFSVWKGLECILIALSAIAIYIIGFAIMIRINFRKEWNENKTPLLQSFFTSFFAPCIIMTSDSKLILWSGLVSMISHIFLTSALLIVANYHSDLLIVKIDPMAFDFLIPIFLLSMVFSWLLSVNGNERTQKLLLSAISFGLLKFFATSLVLPTIDELTDILSAWDYFR